MLNSGKLRKLAQRNAESIKGKHSPIKPLSQVNFVMFMGACKVNFLSLVIKDAGIVP
jgi:hypothetical protein